MHALTNRLEKLIGTLIKSGRFANKSEVVRAGLRLLEDSERDKESASAYIGTMPKAPVKSDKPGEKKPGPVTPSPATETRLVKHGKLKLIEGPRREFTAAQAVEMERRGR